jgi:phosphoribosylformylglycinamidine synthase subunit PurL
VAEAARNLVCAGALPTAVTNNLNFGNPLKPHIYYQLREAVLGMAEACSLFETPVTGGNVSLFNETDGVAIHPTPVIGMVGLLDDVEAHATAPAFRSEGDPSSSWARTARRSGAPSTSTAPRGSWPAPPGGGPPGRAPAPARRARLIQKGVARSAHDCSEGGLAAALAECAVAGEVSHGVDVRLEDDLAPVALFFGETQGRVLVSIAPDDEERALEIARGHGVPARFIGTVSAPGAAFSVRAPRGTLNVEIDAVAHRYHNALPEIMDPPQAASEPGATA